MEKFTTTRENGGEIHNIRIGGEIKELRKTISEIKDTTWVTDFTVKMYCTYGDEQWVLAVTDRSRSFCFSKLLTIFNGPHDQWQKHGRCLSPPGVKEMIDLVTYHTSDGLCGAILLCKLDDKRYRLKVDSLSIREAVQSICNIFDGPPDEWHNHTC